MLSALLAHLRRHVVGYIALFFALGGATYAAIPDAAKVIHGCYDTSAPVNGAYPLYVIDTSTQATCPEGEGRVGPMTPLDWNQQGPSGPQGSPGAQGQPGSAGPSQPGNFGGGGGSPSIGGPMNGGLAGGGSPQGGGGAPAGGSGKAKLVEVFGKTPIANSAAVKTVSVLCPKSAPVALYASVNSWYWVPGNLPPGEELFLFVAFGEATHNIYSLRSSFKGMPEGWTTRWEHQSALAGGRPWGVELEVSCGTVAGFKALAGLIPGKSNGPTPIGPGQASG
jgi:hypothetical protein